MLPGGGWRFTLPVVTSANRLWRQGRGVTYKANGANADTKAAALLFRHVVPLAGELAVSITWHRSQKSGDVDNRIKGTLDLLRGIAYADDAAVARVSCERVDDGTPARLVVDVDNLQPWRKAA
jgi:Holliday junction resolvase RusA-like endonuclease